MSAEHVNWCCEELLRKTGLTKATVRSGEEKGANTWIFTLECRTGSIKRALTLAYLAPQVERMRDDGSIYTELERMARAVVQATALAVADKPAAPKGGKDEKH